MEGEELETTAEDTLYDIVMKGAKAYSQKFNNIEYVSVTTRTNFGPSDPTGIRLFGTFGKKEIKTMSVDLSYSAEHEIPDETLLQLFQHFPRKKFKLEAMQSVKGWSVDRLMKEHPVRLVIEAPMSWGFVDATLPKEGNWIDAELLMGMLNELGIRYSKGERLIIKPFKYKSTSYDAIISACKFFRNHKFGTELKLCFNSTQIQVKQKDDGQSIEYMLYGLYTPFGIIGTNKKRADRFQEIFEKHLSFTASGRNYEFRKDLSELKEKGMKIDYK